MQRTCTQDECDKPHYSRGMCKPHYRKDYYLRNKERENAHFKAYRDANLDRERARWAAYSQDRWGGERQARQKVTAARLAAPDKACTSCQKVKPKGEFHQDSRRLDGLYSWCVGCFNAHTRAYQREWVKANREKAREQVRRRYALKKSVTVERVDYEAIVQRDGMVCYLCRSEITSLEDLHFDHVVPISRGGEHSMANVKLAHATCNLRKHDKLISELDWIVTV